MLFQLWSHAHFYEEGAEPGRLTKPKILRSPAISETSLPPSPEDHGSLRHRGLGENLSKSSIAMHHKESRSSTFVVPSAPVVPLEAQKAASTDAHPGTKAVDEAGRKPTMNIYACVALLVGATTVSLCLSSLLCPYTC